MTLSTDEVKERLRGVSFGLLTPFDDFDIEHTKIEENARRLYDRGARSFLAAANISEYNSLSQDEWVEIVESVVDALPSDAADSRGSAEARAALATSSGHTTGWERTA